jgi:MFS family permease
MLLTEMGFGSTRDALMGMVMVGLVNFLATIVAILTLDRLGRRPLLVVTGILMSLCMAMVAVSLPIEFFSPLVLLAWILGFVVCYAIGVGPGSWLIVSEIFPTRVRGRAMSICTLSLWVVNFLTTLIFPSLWEWTHAGTFWLFAATSAAMGVFVWFMIPETKGLSLEAIEAMWRKRDATAREDGT